MATARLAISLACALAVLPITSAARGATSSSVWTVDTNKVRAGMLDKGRRYLETAWIPARQEALKRGYVRSFRLLTAPKASADQPEFVLITEYADAAQFAAREEHFKEVFAALKTPSTIVVDGSARAEIFEATKGGEDYSETVSGGR